MYIWFIIDFPDSANSTNGNDINESLDSAPQEIRERSTSKCYHLSLI